MAQSYFALMDVRAFTSGRKGCAFERRALIDEVLLRPSGAANRPNHDDPASSRTLAIGGK